MNKEEASWIAQYLSELIEADTQEFYTGALLLRDELSKLSPTFRKSYQSWVEFWKDDAEKHEEFERRMVERYGPGWGMAREANTPEARKWRHDVWVEIFGENAADYSDDGCVIPVEPEQNRQEILS